MLDYDLLDNRRDYYALITRPPCVEGVLKSSYKGSFCITRERGDIKKSLFVMRGLSLGTLGERPIPIRR